MATLLVLVVIAILGVMVVRSLVVPLLVLLVAGWLVLHLAGPRQTGLHHHQHRDVRI